LVNINKFLLYILWTLITYEEWTDRMMTELETNKFYT
jgi:hypothetical protein